MSEKSVQDQISHARRLAKSVKTGHKEDSTVQTHILFLAKAVASMADAMQEVGERLERLESHFKSL